MMKLTRLLTVRNFPRVIVLEKRCIHQVETKSQEREVQEVKIPVPWGHIAGKWWGRTDVQPVIGLHGWEDNAGSFDNLAPLLKVDGFLAIDFPGHGQSTPFPFGRPYFFMDGVQTLRHISNYFNFDKLSVIGHSFGSNVAFTYTALFPGTVLNFIGIECARSMMIRDKVFEVEHIKLVGDRFQLVEEKLEKSKPPSYSYNEIVDLLYRGCLESPTKESCKILLQRGMEKSDDHDDRYFFSRDPRLRFFPLSVFPPEGVLNLATKVNCNHLGIRGKQGLIVEGNVEDIYLRSLELMKKPHFKCEHHDVEGTHHLHMNNAESVAPLINEFLI